MKLIQKLKQRFNKERVRFVPKRYGKKMGKVEWYVTADIVDYNLSFHREYQAQFYRELLLLSKMQMRSEIIRQEIDADGYILTREQEK